MAPTQYLPLPETVVIDGRDYGVVGLGHSDDVADEGVEKKSFVTSAEEIEAYKQKVKRIAEARRRQEADARSMVSLRTLALAVVGMFAGREAARRLPRGTATAGACVAALVVLWRHAAPRRVNAATKGTLLPALPLLGNTAQLLEARRDFQTYTLKAARQTGFTNQEVSAPGKLHMVFIHDEHDRKFILKDKWTHFLKNVEGSSSNFGDVFNEVLRRGIFAVDGEEWRDHRDAASAMFGATFRAKLETVFREHAENLAHMLDDVARKDPTRVLDMQNIFQCFTFDTILEIAFGVHYGAVREALTTGRKPRFLVAFDNVQGRTNERFFEPPFLWRTLRWLNVGPEKKLRGELQVVCDYVTKIIEERRAQNDFGSRDDLLSLYMNHAQSSGQPHIATNAYLTDVILNFMVAGRDTTSCLLTNCIRNLSRTPAAEERLVAEVSGVHDISWDSMRELNYADAVVNEALRLAPSVGTDPRLATEDMTLPSGTIIKKGAMAVIPNYAIGRNPKYWTDPDGFHPERWIRYGADGKPKRVRRPDEYLLPVFFAGPRICLGKDFARFEAKAVLATILPKFHFEVLPHSNQYVVAPVMFLAEGLPTRVSLRQR